jgi:glucose dehydrogenase
MSRRCLLFLGLSALFGSLALPVATPVKAVEVTFERLANADREPHNWLMNHRTYDAQRYSPLARINKSNVKNLRLAYAVALSGTSVNENLEATPNETDLVVADPFTGEIKKKLHVPYPDNSAALTTAGGLLITGFTDGSVAAYDDTSLEELWRFNVGSGINAPPMTFEVGGRQYLAIQSGLARNGRAINSMTPELRELRNQTMLFVFGL